MDSLPQYGNVSAWYALAIAVLFALAVYWINTRK